MQPEAHCVDNIKNSREVWFYWIACERPMNARPRKPGFQRKVRDIEKTGGSADALVNALPAPAVRISGLRRRRF